MRKHFKIIVVAVIAASVLACSAMIFNSVKRLAWTQNAERNVHEAEIIVQNYQAEYGASPKSLKEAFDWVDSSYKTNIANLVGCSNSHYEYQTASNRFYIAIVKSSTWFSSEWKVGQEFEFEDAAKTHEELKKNKH